MSTPCDPVWSRLVRAMVAAGAAPLDFDVDRVDDLVTVTDHCFTEIVEAPGTERLTISLRVKGDRLRVRALGKPAGSGAPSPLDALISRLVDEYHREVTGGALVTDWTLTARTRR